MAWLVNGEKYERCTSFYYNTGMPAPEQCVLQADHKGVHKYPGDSPWIEKLARRGEMVRCKVSQLGKPEFKCVLQTGHKGDHRYNYNEFAGKLARSPFVGQGGAPTRCTTLPEDPKERKTYPVATGFTDYFPDAIAAISHLSFVANEQHNPGEPVHWARSKSTDEADTLLRHFLQRGTVDTDGIRHSVKMAWRALALLQKEIEAERNQPSPEVTDERTQERGTDEIYHGVCAPGSIRYTNSGR